MNLKNNKIAIVLSVLLLGIVAVVFMKSTTGKTVEAPRTFVDVSGQKIILELYNAPDGFLAALLAEDTLGLIERDMEIQSSAEPDNLIFYLENWGELDGFSDSMRRAFNGVPYESDMKSFLLSLTRPDGGIRQMHFVSLAAYAGMSEEAVLCQTVRSIYSDMQFYSGDNRSRKYENSDLFRGCPKD